MNRNINYKKNKRKKIDICNICGKRVGLTWDHVPPKSVLREPDVLTNKLFNGLPMKNAYMKEYQSGIKYRTICENCNNVLLGENDNEYKAFIKKVEESIKAKVNNDDYVYRRGDYIEIPCKINRVLRAICGHLLASKTEYNTKIHSDVFMREYVLNENIKPQTIKIFSWLYSYSTIIVFRDVFCTGHYEETHPKGLVSGISYYPISFIVSLKDEINCNLDDLGKYATENIDEIVTVKLNFDTIFYSGCKRYKDFDWPINLSDEPYGAITVLGTSATAEDSRCGISKADIDKLNGIKNSF